MTTTGITQVLKEQYTLVEKYANAQSRLWNATMASSSSSPDDQVPIVVDNLDTCRCRVRSNLERLQQQEEIQLRYPEHVALSHRVLQTIAGNPSWHPNGIPSHTKNALEVNTVALATLKASIARICELEQT
jgi:hypothetical protein